MESDEAAAPLSSEERNETTMTTSHQIETLFNSETCTFEIPSPATLASLKDAFVSKYEISPELGDQAKFTYSDSDGDDIVFDTDAELGLALRFGRPPLKVKASISEEPTKTEERKDRDNDAVAVVRFHATAARKLRSDHGVGSITGRDLKTVLDTLQLHSRRLVRLGLACQSSLKAIKKAKASDATTEEHLPEPDVNGSSVEEWQDVSDESHLWVDGAGNSEHPVQPDSPIGDEPESSDTAEPIYCALRKAGVTHLRSEHVEPLLTALAVVPKRFVVLGLISKEDLKTVPYHRNKKKTVMVADRPEPASSPADVMSAERDYDENRSDGCYTSESDHEDGYWGSVPHSAGDSDEYGYGSMPGLWGSMWGPQHMFGMPPMYTPPAMFGMPPHVYGMCAPPWLPGAPLNRRVGPYSYGSGVGRVRGGHRVVRGNTPSFAGPPPAHGPLHMRAIPPHMRGTASPMDATTPMDPTGPLTAPSPMQSPPPPMQGLPGRVSSGPLDAPPNMAAAPLPVPVSHMGGPPPQPPPSGPQQHGHGPPPHGHGPPPHGHGPPPHGHAPPPHGHGPPPHMCGPPHDVHGHPPHAHPRHKSGKVGPKRSKQSCHKPRCDPQSGMPHLRMPQPRMPHPSMPLHPHPTALPPPPPHGPAHAPPHEPPHHRPPHSRTCGHCDGKGWVEE